LRVLRIGWSLEVELREAKEVKETQRLPSSKLRKLG